MQHTGTSQIQPPRETFATRFGLLASMIGVAVGLGNVWRFPYMVGRFGGASFVVLYALIVVAIGVPGLMAEWTLGRHTQRGPVGAFERAGTPFGKWLGRLFFLGVVAATGYYTAAIGWVVYYAVGEVAQLLSVPWADGAILPPDDGFSLQAFGLQLLFTSVVCLACAFVLLRGLRKGIERASKVLIPALFIILIVLIIRSVTLEGATSGVDWYVFKFDPSAITGTVVMAALGQAIFTLSLGGTYMVIYGSYLGPGERLRRNAIYTAAGDLTVGLLAGFAILPAVFAFGLEPASGPGLLFETIPGIFARIPGGGIFGFFFFAGLAGAAYLSDVAAFEVLVAGLTDNSRLTRRRAVWLVTAVVVCSSIPPTINMSIFVPWDLTFGSGLQTFGALVAVLTTGWALQRGAVLKALATTTESHLTRLLYFWIRFVIPGAIIAVGTWWLLTDVLGVVAS